MTEASWLTCCDPEQMHDFLRGKVSDRKLRLFACGCCRSIWSALADTRSRGAVDVAERYADGAASDAERDEAEIESVDAWDGQPDDEIWACAAAIHVTKENALVGAVWAARCAAAHFAGQDWRTAVDDAALPDSGAGAWRMAPPETGSRAWQERQQQTAFLRDIIGNPFCATTIHRSLLAWNDATVRRIAQAVYDERAFDRMPILADALEDAGCDNADILNHCRSESPHVRGCWVIDALLGKQ